MKFFVAILFVAAAVADKLENVYLPPNSANTAGGNGNFLAAPLKTANQAQAYNGPTAAPINILRFNNENNGNGQYNYDFETENHIQQQESGNLKNAGSEAETIEAQGSFTFTAPDGQTFSIQYVADENGFQPQGAHIPTAPPVPAEILKALEQNAADEAAGIVDDGQYKPDPSEGFAGRKNAQNNAGYKY
ncbi:unnamed protein product [Brassicogethes aeneus]|uniref:Uncharacterized protein n=1 Tax=Brassicogethes aeneus TaxID=1431903 RepID=A0A9P0B263_BRAAE|nr:unnamed protein product [Brassicogethes aeneus]